MSKKDFFKKLNKSKAAFEKGREAKRGGMIDVPAGDYTVRLHSIELDTADTKAGKGIPYVQFVAVVVAAEDDDHIGGMVRHREYINESSGTNDKGAWKITEADCFANICKTLQSFGVETSELELDDLEQLAEELPEEQPACRIKVVEKGQYLNVWFNAQVDPEELNLPEIDDVLDDEEEDDDEPEADDDDDSEDDDDDEQDEEDDEEEDDEEEEDEDDEPVEPEKGETVKAKPKGTKKAENYEVIRVNKSKQTVALKRVRDDKQFKDQPWDVIVD